VAAYIGGVLVDVCMSHCSGVTSASTDSELPEDGATATKHVRAILMQILILFLRQSLVHSLVNNKP
jgi:hypothetical protein